MGRPEAQPASQLTSGFRPGWMAQGGGSDGRTNGQTNVWKNSPFYRTLSPIGAAALPPPIKTKEKVEQGKGTADHLMPLGYLFFLSQCKLTPKCYQTCVTAPAHTHATDVVMYTALLNIVLVIILL